MVKASQYHKGCHFKRYHLTVNLSEVCGSNMMSLSQYLLWLKIKVKVNKVDNRQGSTGKYQTDRTKVYYAPDHSIWGGMSKKMSLSLIAKVKTDNRQTNKQKDRTKTSKVIVKIYFKVDNRVNRQQTDKQIGQKQYMYTPGTRPQSFDPGHKNYKTI